MPSTLSFFLFVPNQNLPGETSQKTPIPQTLQQKTPKTRQFFLQDMIQNGFQITAFPWILFLLQIWHPVTGSRSSRCCGVGQKFGGVLYTKRSIDVYLYLVFNEMMCISLPIFGKINIILEFRMYHFLESSRKRVTRARIQLHHLDIRLLSFELWSPRMEQLSTETHEKLGSSQLPNYPGGRMHREHLLYLLQASWAAGAAAAKPPVPAPGTGDLKEVVGRAQPGRWGVNWTSRHFFWCFTNFYQRKLGDLCWRVAFGR